MMIKVSFYQEDNNNYITQKWIEMKEGTDNSMLTVEDFSTLLSIVYRLARQNHQKISTVNQLDLEDLYRTAIQHSTRQRE